MFEFFPKYINIFSEYSSKYEVNMPDITYFLYI